MFHELFVTFSPLNKSSLCHKSKQLKYAIFDVISNYNEKYKKLNKQDVYCSSLKNVKQYSES